MKLPLCTLSLVSLLAVSCSKESAAAPEPVRPVRAVKVGNVSDFQNRSFPGTARAKEEVDIGFEVAGRLIERDVKVGDRVEKGQVLARLDPRDFENEVEAGKARVKRSEAYHERIARAAATNAVSQQELTDAIAQLEMSQAQLKIREKALSDSRIVAPFAGTVAVTYVENFWNVRAKQAVIRLLDTSRIKVDLNLPENYISLIPFVKTTRCTFEAFPDHVVVGEVYEVGTQASETTRTYLVTIIMDQPEGFVVLPGMSCDVTADETELPEGAQVEGYYLPPTALISREGQESIVWVIDEATGVVSARDVENLGMGAFGILVGGLEKDTWVATAGGHYLKEGQKVRILAAAADAGGQD